MSSRGRYRWTCCLFASKRRWKRITVIYCHRWFHFLPDRSPVTPFSDRRIILLMLLQRNLPTDHIWMDIHIYKVKRYISTTSSRLYTRITYALHGLYTGCLVFTANSDLHYCPPQIILYNRARRSCCVAAAAHEQTVWMITGQTAASAHSIRRSFPRMHRGVSTIAYSLLGHRSSAHGLNFSDHRTLMYSQNEAARIQRCAVILIPQMNNDPLT